MITMLIYVGHVSRGGANVRQGDGRGSDGAWFNCRRGASDLDNQPSSRPVPLRLLRSDRGAASAEIEGELPTNLVSSGT